MLETSLSEATLMSRRYQTSPIAARSSIARNAKMYRLTEPPESVRHALFESSLILTNGSRCETIDASGAGLPYFARLVADIRDRTETAMPQAHAFKVMELAITAQEMADRTATDQ